MSTHSFNDDADPKAGGWFVDSEGRLLCRWTYDEHGPSLTVRYGPRGHKAELANLGLEEMSNDELRTRLVELARDFAQMHRGIKFD